MKKVLLVSTLLVVLLFGYQNCVEPEKTKSSKNPVVDQPPLQALHIVCPNGSFAWFQQLWPQVEVAQKDQFGVRKFSYFEAASSGNYFLEDTDGNKHWFASSKAPWILPTGDPIPGMEVTAFMAGRDETHTQFPYTAAIISGQSDLLAGVAAIQVKESSAILPVAGFEPGASSYGSAPDAPPIQKFNTIGDFIFHYNNVTGDDLTPTAQDLIDFGIDNLSTNSSSFTTTQRNALIDFGNQMIVAAKALTNGYSESIVVSLGNNPTSDTNFQDPHNSFNSSADLVRTINTVEVLGKILEGFHSYLEKHRGPNGVGTRADSTLITVFGDTPHTPVQGNTWPDAMPRASNWIYVVGKGFLKHGWFGGQKVETTDTPGNSRHPNVYGFDGTDGSYVLNKLSSQTATIAGSAIAFAVTRGDAEFVKTVLGGHDISEYQGIVNKK